MTRKKKHQSTFLKKEERAFWGFISPWLIGFILLTFGPMLYSFYASFTNWNGIKAPNLSDWKIIEECSWTMKNF
ncbi:MAG: hypothetical protein ACLSCO_13210 [Gallintestinimicrobium sp.]